MQAQHLIVVGFLVFSSLVPACSTSNNDVGSVGRDGSATGGVAGSAKGGTVGSGGATGGVAGSATGGSAGTGGATGASTCTYRGKTYAVGESFKDDCNTCSCGAFGDTIVRCTTMACLGTGGLATGTGGLASSGGVAGTGGAVATGGRFASGGASGSQGFDGGSGQTCTFNGKIYPNDVTWPSSDGCHECWCLGDIGVCDAGPPCDGGVSPAQQCTYDGKSYPTGISFPSTDGCNTCECSWKWSYNQPACTLNACPGSSVVDGSAGAEACTYNGRSYPIDTHFAAAGGCGQCHCRSDGQVACTFNCQPDAGSPDTPSDTPVSVDAPPFEVGPLITVDAAIASACGNCGFDELCVAYYDGTCHPMGTTCNKVSAATRDAILVSHTRCLFNALGDEVCAKAFGQPTWACGEPSCSAEPLVSDINCYGI